MAVVSFGAGICESLYIDYQYLANHDDNHRHKTNRDHSETFTLWSSALWVMHKPYWMVLCLAIQHLSHNLQT